MKKTPSSQTKRTVTPPTLTKRFKSFLGKKNQSSRDDERENWDDDAPSRPLVRFLVVLLLLQLVVIGGILLRGYFTKNGLASPTEKFQPLKLADSSAGAKAKPAAPQTPDQAPAAPREQLPAATGSLPAGNPATGTAGQTAQPAHNPPAPSEVGLIDEPAFGAGETPQLPAPTSSSAIRSTATKRVTHLVLSGDTWDSIAHSYGCTVQELKTANPGAVLRNNLTLVIPPPPGVVQAVVVDEDAADAGGTYTIAKGDNLYRIAKKHKTTVQKIMKANNFTDADARRLKPGQVIKLN